jgi:hypothetical protein
MIRHTEFLGAVESPSGAVILRAFETAPFPMVPEEILKGARAQRDAIDSPAIVAEIEALVTAESTFSHFINSCRGVLGVSNSGMMAA